MHGEIMGDVIGKRFEFDRGGKTKDFELLTAETFFEMPEELKDEVRKRGEDDMLPILDQFDERMAEGKRPFRDGFLEGNELIEAAIEKYYEDDSKDNLAAVLETIR